MKLKLTALSILVFSFIAWGQTPYKLPPQEVVDIIDAPPTPFVSVSPQSDAMLLIDYKAHPSVELLSRPILRLAGIRIDPAIKNRQRMSQLVGYTLLRTETNERVKINAPSDGRILQPAWSNDGKRIAFRHDLEDGTELWIADAGTGEARAVPGIRLNDILGSPLSWLSDNIHLLVKVIPEGAKEAPKTPKVPIGPNVDETSGKVAKVMTYQDMLRTPHDEDLFDYYGRAQLAIVDATTGRAMNLGEPGLIMSADFSPDGKYILVEKLKRPFSYRVPYYYFARTTEVWDRNGAVKRVIADLPISDDIPTQGEPLGPRNVIWQQLKDATLLWIEALDGGDPMRKAEHRDKIMRLEAPFAAEAREVMKIKHRFSAIDFTAKEDKLLLTEYDRDRRWQTTWHLDMDKPEQTKKMIVDISVNDAYNDPGNPVYKTSPDGMTVLHQDGDWIYLSASGASEAGDRPRFDMLNLRTLEKKNLFRSGENSLERLVAFAGKEKGRIITRHESKTEPPNYFLTDLKTKARRALTDFRDPAPRLTGLKKEILKYYRKDGVPLSGTFYLPPGYAEGSKLPLVIWAYPLEYSDPSTAGQVRGSANSFTFFRGTTPLFFLTQGYAVLMDATMPVVGDPETMNETFVEQITSAGRAAIDKLDSTGTIDRNRVLVMGHSYGAFMTANLLAHSDDFAAGIARSGAYNRTLTPFGFQSERRSFWEARETYMKLSPFTYADKINEPLLMIHGDADNNPGTFTMQSERLFQAIKGNGGTSRLVLLPYESHGYTGRESVLHTLAEMFDWADKYVKMRK